MEIRDILNLEASNASIKKIEAFLSTQKPQSRDYPKALSHLAYLSFKLGNVSDAFKLIMGYLEICSPNDKPILYNALIKIYYDLKDYDKVYETIEAKKAYLKNYNHAIYYEDLITYYDKIKDKKNLIKNLLIYLDDDISDQRRLLALDKLTEVYLELKDYPHFKQKNNLMASLSLTLKDDILYRKSKFNEAYVLFLEEKYQEALEITNELLEMTLDLNQEAYALSLKINILVGLKEYRKASIFEAEVEEKISKSDVKAQKFFNEGCLKLYENLNNRYNAQVYLDKLNKLSNSEEETLLKDSKKKKVKEPLKLDLSFLEELKEKEVSKVEPLNEVKIIEKEIINEEKEEEKEEVLKPEFNFILEAKKITNLEELFLSMNEKNDLSLREYLRIFFLNLQKFTTFKEAFILVKNPLIHGYYYKKERLYDKKSDKLFLEDSLFLKTLDQKEEIIILNSKDTLFKNGLTNNFYKDEEKCSILSFNLYKGSITFINDNDSLIYEKVNYEALRLAISYLNLKLKMTEEIEEIKKQNEDSLYLIDNVLCGYKRQVYNYLTLSKKVSKLFNLPKNIFASEFYSLIKESDLINYKKLINSLLEGNLLEASLTYEAKIEGVYRTFKEDFSITKDKVILSVINDITEDKKKISKAYNDSLIDSLSKVYTKNKLDLDLDKFLENRFSMFILNVCNFKLYNELYGLDFGDDLIYAIGKYLKEFKEYPLNVYHYDSDKFIFIIDDLVDQRTVLKVANKVSKYLNFNLHSLNYRLNLHFEIGILRYPTDTSITNHNELLRRLLNALTEAHSNLFIDTSSIYKEEKYKKRFFESELVTHISESIDENLLKINYKQVINYKEQTTLFYEAVLNLSNYSVKEEEIFKILKLRNKFSQIERYMIHKGCFELSEIHKAIKLYFKVSFKVSYETLVDETFFTYVKEQLKFFNLPKDVFILEYNDKFDFEVLKVLNLFLNEGYLIRTSNLEVLKNVKVQYFTYNLPTSIYNLENTFIASLKAFSQKEDIKFILGNTNNTRILNNYSELGIIYYSGKLYNALLEFKDIIKAYKN